MYKKNFKRYKRLNRQIQKSSTSMLIQLSTIVILVLTIKILYHFSIRYMGYVLCIPTVEWGNFIFVE